MVRQWHDDAVPTVYNWYEDIPTVEIREGVYQQVFRGMHSIIGLTKLEPSLEPGPHSHPWEQLAFILEGECDFHVGDEVLQVGPGDMFFIPPSVEHYADPSDYDEPVVNLDVWPLREDYLPRTEYQSEWVEYDNE